MPDRNGDTLGHVGLAAVGGAEHHRRGRVEHEPRDEHALGQMHTDVRNVGARGHVPVDPAHVVAAGNVRPHLRELGPLPQQRGAIVAREQPFHAAADADVERAQQGLGQRPRPGPRGCRLGAEQLPHAAPDEAARSVFGTGTVARTRSRIASGVISSASAW